VAHEIGRRAFLELAGAGALGVLAACSSSSSNGSSAGRRRASKPSLPAPTDAPLDTVVVMMMENRSFDHFLGWLPDADGRQAGLSYADGRGVPHSTFRLAPDFQGCGSFDPKHDWESAARQFNGGKCDGFLRTQSLGDRYPIGYYSATDLPITGALARGHTVCDRYFCSVMGPTGPNRMYAWSATTDYLEFDGILNGQGKRPSNVQLAIWDRLRAANVSGLYYAGKEPSSYMYSSKKYDDIIRTHAEFFDAAAKGALPHVAWFDPDLDSIAEFLGTANDDHPYGDVRTGEAFVARVYRALAASPQWNRMVFVLTFDEHGGFYEHVPPPTVADDTVLPGPGPHPDLQRLGFRVPCIVMGPFAPSRVVSTGPYEHCSILRMIEWRWGLEPMTARDRGARNLAEALDFSARQRPVELPSFAPPPPAQCTPAQIDAHAKASA
jgi:phospholipase C